MTKKPNYKEQILNQTTIILYNFFDTLEFEDSVLKKIVIDFNRFKEAKNFNNLNRDELIDIICHKVVYMQIKMPSPLEEPSFDLHGWLKNLVDDHYWEQKDQVFQNFMSNIDNLKTKKSLLEIKKNQNLISETIRQIKGDGYVS